MAVALKTSNTSPMCVRARLVTYSRACWYGYGVGTGQLTVTNGTLSKSWNLDFHD